MKREVRMYTTIYHTYIPILFFFYTVTNIKFGADSFSSPFYLTYKHLHMDSKQANLKWLLEYIYTIRTAGINKKHSFSLRSDHSLSVYSLTWTWLQLIEAYDVEAPSRADSRVLERSLGLI